MIRANGCSRWPRIRNCDDHKLTAIAEVVIGKENGEKTAKSLLKNLVNAIDEHRVYEFNYRKLLYVIAQKQPLVFLDEFSLDDEGQRYKGLRMFFDEMESKNNPVDAINKSILLDWCESKGSEGYSVISNVICPFHALKENDCLEWKDVALDLLESAPNLDGVLDAYRRSFRPMSWSGSRASIMEKRLPLFEQLYNHKITRVASWAKTEYTALEVEITQEREFELARNKEDNESFE